MRNSFDAIVIGSGQAGMKTALVERAHLGGACVNDGCIPTKTLIASARTAHVARRAADYGVDIGGAGASRHESGEGEERPRRHTVDRGSDPVADDDAESERILGAALLCIEGDEIVHSLVDVMAADASYKIIERAVHVHPTVSELIPTLLGNLVPLGAAP